VLARLQSVWMCRACALAARCMCASALPLPYLCSTRKSFDLGAEFSHNLHASQMARLAPTLVKSDEACSSPKRKDAICICDSIQFDAGSWAREPPVCVCGGRGCSPSVWGVHPIERRERARERETMSNDDGGGGGVVSSVGRMGASVAKTLTHTAVAGVRGTTIAATEVFLLGPIGPLITRGGRAVGRGALDAVHCGLRCVHEDQNAKKFFNFTFFVRSERCINNNDYFHPL
jgi:hypothetical protein